MAEKVRFLIVPGLGNSGPDHWQTRWEKRLDNSERVDLGAWDNPHRSHWVTKLDMAIAAAREPVVLIAHSLGCFAVAWWVALAAHERKGKVGGALLVAPPDVEHRTANASLARFGPSPHSPFPFTAILVASTNDRYATIERSAQLARGWGAAFYDIGALGHINADSQLGDWVEGLAILESLAGRRLIGHNLGIRQEKLVPRLKQRPASH